ncbi:MAG: DNA polymerase III subunit gamma/tau [Candidatus Gracilibacteria bacterium]|nr:DNA polymerase III subunit gamma/tau [Candidatus Gracilibacteria bacterium]
MAEDKKLKIALYRKYRPQDFSNLVGQNSIQITLQNALKSGKASHAYLFCGPRGTGKTSTARLIAKGLNCLDLSETGEPCNKCENCLEITANRMMDIIEIDAASNRGVDEIRELREKVKFSPSHGLKKVFIIDEVHMLTKEAFNALLKTLEEPPSHAHFILATTESHKIPPTIISRCQRFDFKRITPEVIAERLAFIAEQEGIKAEAEALILISKAADGGMRDAISLFEQMANKKGVTLEHVEQNLGLVKQQIVSDFINFLLERNHKAAISLVNQIYFDGIDLKQFVKATLEMIREKMINELGEDKDSSTAAYLEFINILQESMLDFKASNIPQLPLETAVLTICLREQPEVLQTIEIATSEKATAEPVQEKVVPPPAENIQGDFNLAKIKQQWGRVIEGIKNPSLKLALKKVRLETLEGQELTISVPSNFELQRLKVGNNLHELEDVLRQVTAHPLHIKCKHKAPESEPDNTEALVDEAIKLFQ